MSRGERLARAIAGMERPLALLDLEAFDRNLDRLLRPLGALTLRVATKSVRCPSLLRRVLARPQAEGLLVMHAREAKSLVDLGFDDLLVAYPPSPEDVSIVAELAARGVRIWATVDGVDAVDALATAARALDTEVALAMDVDCSLRLAGAHLGVRRSPIRRPEQARVLARHIAGTAGVRLSAVLAYEAQIAGVQDRTGGVVDLAVRLVKRRSRGMVMKRRAAILHVLQDESEIELVNGGGTGSIDWSVTDPALTEVSAGSGLFCPHSFDGYRGLELEPAAFFALAVVRSSDLDFVTCYGGGFSASGAAGPDRAPRVFWPDGLESVAMESFGEVQTPFRWRGRGPAPSWGSTVLCRHAKAGELMEHFASVACVLGDEVVEQPQTYRGLGFS